MSGYLNNLIAVTALSIFSISFIPWLFITLFLTFKLRKDKYKMIHDISKIAPYKFRDRAKFIMESNPSWIFSASFLCSWYLYLMMRFGWRISALDIKIWQQEIKKVFSKFYIYYSINNMLTNILITTLPISLAFIYISKM